MSPPGVEPVLPSWKIGVVTASSPSRTNIYIYKCEGGCLKRAHLTNTHSQGFFMSPPGVEPVLPSWKIGAVTAWPPSRSLACLALKLYNDNKIFQ